jgi:predicted O-methyltransferase YrrM
VTHFSEDWCFHFRAAAKRHLSPGQPLRALEIGVFEGRGACWLLNNVLTHPDARYCGIDPYAHYELHDRLGVAPEVFYARARANLAPYGDKVQLIREPSVVALPKLAPESFDYIYVDGDHRPAPAAVDGLLAWQLLKPGGIMAWDDLRHHRHCVRQGWDAFMSLVGAEAIILEEEYQGWIRKAVRPAGGIADEDITFLMHTCDERRSAERAIAQLRRVYPRARVILVSDGGADRRYLATRHSCEYVAGERLFAVERGGEILSRMLTLYLQQPTPWLIKIDPDTAVHRRFAWLPTSGVFGSPNDLVRKSIQGGCLGICRDAAKKLLEHAAAWLPACQDWRNWALDIPVAQERATRDKLTSIDWTLAFACRQLGIPVHPILEVKSSWREIIPAGDYAVTHRAVWSKPACSS